uniref:Uncharacterized protein n=1 Tax=viral metagenome TaxID=1070528 RepID=A0A6M3LRK8_9ZZZZ
MKEKDRVGMPGRIDADYGGFSRRVPLVFVEGAWDDMMEITGVGNMEWFMGALVNRLSPMYVKECEEGGYWEVGKLKGLQIIEE